MRSVAKQWRACRLITCAETVLCWICGACEDGENTFLWNIGRRIQTMQHYIPGDRSLHHYLCFQLWPSTLWHHMVTSVLEQCAALAKVSQSGEVMMTLKFTEQVFWGSNNYDLYPRAVWFESLLGHRASWWRFHGFPELLLPNARIVPQIRS